MDCRPHARNLKWKKGQPIVSLINNVNTVAIRVRGVRWGTPLYNEYVIMASHRGFSASCYLTIIRLR